MKRTLTLIVSVLALAGLYSCETDLSGIEQDIKDLQDKVTELEAEVDDLNYDLKALDDFLKSGQTVKDIEDLGNGTYKITLGNGTEYTINAVTSAPVLNVSVDAEGYWTLDGKRIKDASGNDVRALGENGAAGENGKTPIFGVDSEGYWTVKFAADETPERVLGADGQPVKAQGPKGDAGAPGTGGEGGTAAPSLFKSVTAENGILTIVLNDGNDTTYTLPIAADFYCMITEVEGEVAFSVGETRTFAVSMKGVASAKIDAPQGWKASLDVAESGDAVLYVTAPGPATKAVVADTERDIVITAYSSNGLSVITKISVYVDDSVDLVAAANGERANCYIVAAGGKYRFAADYIVAEGDGSFDNTAIVAADWLWCTGSESLISEVSYSRGNKSIYFTVADNAKGNAVIAATDASGNIVWSWHIWMASGMETPMEPHNYIRGNTWVMSDINLGATSKEVGNQEAYGLVYQYGRKDPFPGAGATTYDGANEAVSFETQTVPYVVNVTMFPTAGFKSVANKTMGNDDVAYVTKNPMHNVHTPGEGAYKEGNDVTSGSPWTYNLSHAEIAALWSVDSNVKTVYDPCPAGYQVPVSNNVWNSKTITGGFTATKEETLNGYVFDAFNMADEAVKTYYPAAGWRRSGQFRNVGQNGYYWTAFYNSSRGSVITLALDGTKAANNVYQNTSCGFSIRCMKRK